MLDTSMTEEKDCSPDNKWEQREPVQVGNKESFDTVI
jgi:hypothetical protein